MTLPTGADLTQLRAQAKELRRAASKGNPAALARVAAVRPADPTAVTLREAQLVIAREHGFPGWRELVQECVSGADGRPVRDRDLHRWFGVELNNSLFDQLDRYQPDTPLPEPERLLYQAYAACFHWMHAGTVVNHGRGEYGIACAALAVGRTEIAGHHARRYAELIESAPVAFADWDRAFCAEILARVAAASGAADAAEQKAAARGLAEAVAEDGDRAVVLDRFAKPPWFGI